MDQGVLQLNESIMLEGCLVEVQRSYIFESMFGEFAKTPSLIIRYYTLYIEAVVDLCNSDDE